MDLAAILGWSLPSLSTWQWLLLLVLALFLYKYLKGGTLPPLPLPQHNPHWITGNAYNSKVSLIDNIRNFYDAMKQHKISIFWEFHNPAILVSDLELIKRVQVTDFEYFVNGGLLSEDYLDVMGLQFGLLDTKDEEWKTLKKLVTPAFSGPRIKKLAGGMNKAGKLFIKHLKTQEENKKEVDILKDLELFSMTCLADVGFGVDANCFEYPDNAFLKHGKGLMEMWRFLMLVFFPGLMKWLRISVFNPKHAKHFEKLCHKVVEQRKASKIEMNDILDNLIRAEEDCSLMTPDMMFRTMIQFFTDGFEGFSRISSIIVYLITVHPEVQDKMLEEMEDVLGDREEVTEEDTRNLFYLEQVISEALRMCPVMFTYRECGKPYQVPGTQHVIPQGTRLILPIAGLHYDPDIWGDPEVFRPERFSSENKGSIPSGAYQPFGFGPRQCIGFNLMKMELKVLLCHLVKNFRISPRGEMGMPLKFHKTETFMLEDGVNVIITSRN